MRASHKVIALRFYDMNPEHQRNLQWLDGLSGPTLQWVMHRALFIGLPQVLAAEGLVSSAITSPVPDASPVQGATPVQAATPPGQPFCRVQPLCRVQPRIGARRRQRKRRRKRCRHSCLRRKRKKRKRLTK